jgi:hypothetical protein
VFSDNAYGNVRRIQKLPIRQPHHRFGLHNPDWVKLADSFGVNGVRRNPADLTRQIEAAMGRADGTLIGSLCRKCRRWPISASREGGAAPRSEWREAADNRRPLVVFGSWTPHGASKVGCLIGCRL